MAERDIHLPNSPENVVFSYRDLLCVRDWIMEMPLFAQDGILWQDGSTTIVDGEFFLSVAKRYKGRQLPPSVEEGDIPAGLQDSIFVQGHFLPGEQGEFEIGTQRVPTSKIVETDPDGTSRVFKQPEDQV